MSSTLEVYEVTNPMDPILLGSINVDQIYVGHEPGDGGITVPNQAISRQHGIFIKYEGHIFYRDLGSTNGSWCNGFTVSAGQTRHVRSGDIIQLANTAIRIGKESAADSGETTALFVLNGENFVEMIRVPAFGRALVIGGAGSNYPIQEQVDDLPALVIEQKTGGLSAYTITKAIKAKLNGREISEAMTIKDGDEIKVGDYTILASDPKSKKRAELGAAKELLDMSHTSLMGSITTQENSPHGYSDDGGWSRPAGEPTEATIAFDPKIAQKYQTRMGDAPPSFRASGTGHNVARISRPAPGSLEAWLAGFTIFCLVAAFAVFLYILLLK